jgi:cytochrome c551/c552
LKGSLTAGIVALGVGVAGLLNTSSTAQAAALPVIYVVPARPASAALGLYVPGAGATVSRASSVASLRRGKVLQAILGGKPGGKVLVDLRFGFPSPPPPRAVYVQLPPPGTHPNTRRYLVAIDAAGFDGILTSDSTRIRGLVSIPDITQTAVALAEGKTPDIRSVSGTRADLQALDDRMARIHHDRGWAMAVLVITYVAFVALAPTASVVAPAAAIAASLVLSALGATRFWVVLVSVVALTVALAFASTARRHFIPAATALFLVVYLALLAWSPETNALAVLGARPDGGGRFYGIGNQLETLLLPPVIAAVVVAGTRWIVPLGALALVTVGWSKAGADGGGLVVFAAALAVLFLRLRPAPLTWRRTALAAAAAVALVLALIGIDAALGGSSHVTHAVGSGSALGDFGRRLHLSWATVTRAWYVVVLFLGCLAGLVWIAARWPRRPGVDAMLVAVVVSLLVNDTPVDVILLGALGCLALLRFESVDSRRMRRRGASIAVCLLAALALSGCGGRGVVSPTPETVVGTVKQEAPGKAIFVTQGCGACHTYTPAGPDAKGQIGPDLDKLATYAKEAKQPLATFVHDSIVDPNKFVGKQCPPSGTSPCPKNVMPKSYKSLPASDLKDLVDFLTKPQG